MYYIYKIENLVNGKKYIGLTDNIRRRRNRHFTDLNCNRHDNKFLQKEFNIYGKENFSFEKIFEGDLTPKEIGDKEKEYIKYYDSYLNGYNQNEGGNFGPSNGGSKLIQSDILNILAATEFLGAPGGLIKDIYGISNTTTMRIKKGINHVATYELYHNMSEEERRKIFDIFCETNDLYGQIKQHSRSVKQRKLSDEQALMILTNFEYKVVPTKRLIEYFGVGSYVAYSIRDGINYKDCKYKYENLTEAQKQEFVSLLREKQL